MATYTKQQLYGSGSFSEDLSGLKTFTFTNPSGSSYFVMETLRNSNEVYDSTSPTNCVGIYSTTPSTIVKSNYIAGFVIPGGVTSFTCRYPSIITGTTLHLRGTCEFSLTIT